MYATFLLRIQKELIMNTKLSEQFKLDKSKLDDLDVLDIILDVDSKLFMDPSLLENTAVPEFQDATTKVSNYFSVLIDTLTLSSEKEDYFWRCADKHLRFKEYPGSCLGYSQNGTQGNSIGATLRHEILTIIQTLIQKGRDKPKLLQLIGVFGENIGCDRVSDLLIHVLHPEILAFTNRITTSFGIDNCTIKYEGKSYRSCINPFNKQPLLLIPQSCLTALPLSEDLNFIEKACRANEKAREDLNNLVNLSDKINKVFFFKAIQESQPIADVFLNLKAQAYDFKNDPQGVMRWLDDSRKLVGAVPFDTFNNFEPSDASTYDIAIFLCSYFKKCIEIHNAGKLLRDKFGKPRREEYVQLFFFSVANLYCHAFNLDLSRETNNGRGPLDFKISNGTDKVIIETKLSTNTRLIQGIKKQLPIYMRQESCTKGIYLVINFGQDKTIKKLSDFYNALSESEKEKIKLIIIDATAPTSASKA